MFWLASQAWVFASDVDLGVSFLAGPAALVDALVGALVGEERLGASHVEPDQPMDLAWSPDLRADPE